MSQPSEELTLRQRLAVLREIRILAMTQRLNGTRALDEYETQLTDKLMEGRKQCAQSTR